MLSLAAIMVTVEFARPAFRRAVSGRWWLRAGLFNAAQAAVAGLGAISWDLWFATSQRAWRTLANPSQLQA